MRVLILSNLFPSRREPTRGVFNLNRFRALALHCPVRVVAPVPCWSRARRPRELLLGNRERESGLEATFPTYWSIPRLQRLHGRAMSLSLAPHLGAVRRDFPFDAILAAWAYPDGFAAAQLARRFDVPLVTMVLGSDVNDFPKRPGLADPIRAGLRAASRVVAVSEALRARVIDLGIDPARVIVQRNCVDGDRFRIADPVAARRKLGLPPESPLLLYVGNWVPEKGVEVLVQAMSRVRALGAELILVGGGPLEPALRAAARASGIADRVRFIGRRPHDEIPAWMAAADAVVLPSYREGCPNVVLEALASGRPVVASRVGGVPELLDDARGALVPPGDPAALAAALDRTLARRWNPDELRAAVPSLSWEQYGATLHRCLTEALEPRPQPAPAYRESPGWT